jgi:hypothetical protein
MEPVRGAIEHPYDLRHSLLIVPLQVALGGGEDANEQNRRWKNWWDLPLSLTRRLNLLSGTEST